MLLEDGVLECNYNMRAEPSWMGLVLLYKKETLQSLLPFSALCHVSTLQEDPICKVGGVLSPGTWTCYLPHLWFLASKSVRSECLLFKLPSLYFGYITLNWFRHMPLPHMPIPLAQAYILRDSGKYVSNKWNTWLHCFFLLSASTQILLIWINTNLVFLFFKRIFKEFCLRAIMLLVQLLLRLYIVGKINLSGIY